MPAKVRHELPRHQVGRAMTWRSSEEVLENDGWDDKNTWISIGSGVYDITGKY